MIAKKVVSFSRDTGEVISEKIVGEVDMTEDEYWDPLVKLIAKRESFQCLISGAGQAPMKRKGGGPKVKDSEGKMVRKQVIEIDGEQVFTADFIFQQMQCHREADRLRGNRHLAISILCSFAFSLAALVTAIFLLR